VQSPANPGSQSLASCQNNALTAASVGHYRWVICALLFFATTINYVDRQVLGLLAPMLQSRIGWNELQYGYIVSAFQAAYAIGILLLGRLIDRIGTRMGYALAIAIWSASAMAHALVRTPLGFGIARFALGLGESGNFPAAIKTVAEWFPRKERALATGIFNSGTNLGATIGPLVIPGIALKLGWRFAFLFTGIFSVIWLVCWLAIYRPPEEHRGLSGGAYIQSDPREQGTGVRWLGLLAHRETWAFVLGKAITDPVWWFLLFWLPKFLASEHDVSLLGLRLPLVVVFNAASIGSIVGGWLPARLLHAGWSLNRARKTAMLVCALAVVPILAAARIRSLWSAVALISLAAAAHQGWAANMFTLASDMFPKRALGSVVGLGGFGGAFGGMLIAMATGLLLQLTHTYTSIFFTAAFAYLAALWLIHILVPRIEMVTL
jgi:MFS transporter, ACS family, hexuronate transporter